MHEVVAYKRLKTMESYKTVSSKSGLSDLLGALFYERFQLLAFTGKMFYKLRDSQSYGRMVLVRGGRTWRFNFVFLYSIII